MSPTIFISSISVMHLALLKRAMRYSVVSVNEILARITSIAVSIALGWAGWGYWALVAGAVAQSLATSVGAWSACRWFPGQPRRVAGTAAMVRFALNVYARFSVNYSARNTDNLLVGWRFSAQSLGFYKKAYDLSFMRATWQGFLAFGLSGPALAQGACVRHGGALGAHYRRVACGSGATAASFAAGPPAPANRRHIQPRQDRW